MNISPQDREMIRQCAKDDESFQTLLRLFEQQTKTHAVQRTQAINTPIDFPYLDKLPTSIILTDAHQSDNPVIYVNAAFERDTGYSREEVIGKNLRFLQGDERDQPELEVVRQALADNKPCYVILRNYRKDGTLFWNELHISPIYDQSGEIIHHIGVHHDVTEQHLLRKQSQSTLQSRLMLYQSIVANTQDGLMLINRDYVYEVVNQPFLNYVGLPREAVEGHKLAEVIGERYFQTTEKPMIDRCLAGKNIRFSEWFESPTKGRRYLQANYAPYRDEHQNIIGVVGNVRDITELRQMEDALRESELFNRAVTQLTANLIYIYDVQQKRNVWVNEAHRQIFSMSIKGQSTDELDEAKIVDEMLTTDDWEKVLDSTQWLIDHPDEKEWQEREYRIKTVDGKWHWLHERATIFKHNSAGEVTQIICTATDITQQKEVEALLRESEAQAHAILEAMPDVIFHFNHEGQYLQIHTNKPELLYKPKDDLLGKTITEVLPEEYAQQSLQAIKQTLRLSKIQTYEFQIRLANGLHDFESRMVPSGENEVISIVRDVTNRKRIEKALRYSEERFRSIIENIPIMIGLVNPEGKLDFTNPFWEERLGWTAQELALLENPFSVFYPDPNVAHKVQSYVHSGNTSWADFETLTKSKETIYTAWANVHLSDGSIMGIGQDITKRKRAEEALRISEERARILLDAIPDLIFRFNRFGMYLDYHGEQKDLLDQSGNFVGKHISDNVPPEMAKRTLKNIEAALETNSLQINEYQLEIPNRGLRDYESRMLPSGKDEVIAIVRDVTERNKAQQNEIALALERERLGILRQFIQKAAHEFRTPLSTINTGLYIMSKTGDEERRHLKAAQIQDQVDRMTHLIETMLTIVRLDNDMMVFDTEVDVGVVLLDVCQRHIVSERECAQLDYQMPAVRLPKIAGSVDNLEEAFNQLLDNACRFTPKDGTVTIKSGVIGQQIFIAFIDTGIGIHENDLPHIFELFWRQDDAHSTPGFGLGLPIAQRIIQKHDGTINVSSHVGEGSHFTVYFPIP